MIAVVTVQPIINVILGVQLIYLVQESIIAVIRTVAYVQIIMHSVGALHVYTWIVHVPNVEIVIVMTAQIATNVQALPVRIFRSVVVNHASVYIVTL